MASKLSRDPREMWRQASIRRKGGIIGTLLALAVLILALIPGTTGAYQSSVLPNGHLHGKGATLTGTSTDPGNFTFENMQPGVEQSHDFTVTNTGSVPADIWLTFPNKTALSTLNNLGTYGHFRVNVTRGGVVTTIFESSNLNDRGATCGAFSPPGCWPLQSQLQLGSQPLDPSESVTISLEFNYAGKMVNVPPVFNQYPLPAGVWSPTNPNGQTYVDPHDGSGDGLSYAIVLMQTGHAPA